MMSYRPRYLGLLILVVGPSGAGKDSLLNGARRHFAGDPRFRFVRRFITRPAEAGGEDHIPVSEQDFAQKCADGAFALAWDAHGWRYGIPADIAVDLAHGRVVVANVSRTAIARAWAAFPTEAIEVTASPDILRQRLIARGREDADDIARRVARAAPEVTAPRIHRIVNDSSLEEGIAAFAALLGRAAEAVWPIWMEGPARTG